MDFVEIIKLVLCLVITVCSGYIIFSKRLIKTVYALFLAIIFSAVILLLNNHSFLAISLFLFAILVLVVISSFSKMLNEIEIQERKASILNVFLGSIVGLTTAGVLIYCLLFQNFPSNHVIEAATENELQLLGMQFMENNILILELAGMCFLQLLIGGLLFLRKVKNEN